MRRIIAPVAAILACLSVLLARPAAAEEAPPATAPAGVPAPAAATGDATTPAAVDPPAAEAGGNELPPVEVKDSLPHIVTVDLTVPPDDLWERIRHGFAMPNLDSNAVVDWQGWYLSRPEYLKRVIDRSHRYLYHIVEELEKRGMPTELALLPMVESAYNPMAYSPAHASGIWQFIPSTGKNFRLEQNWWVDQRRDIIASTAAALEYLEQIYEMHGDWHLALASYNWGEGAVARAIAKNKAKGLPTDYLSLSMPAETRNYVPKLQALKNIVARPELFNVNLEAIPNRPYFITVEKPADMDVALAAKLAEMSVEEFVSLNPAYKRPVMPGKDKASIVLPADKAEIFKENLDNHDTPLVSWQAYTLKKGERLDTVAARHGITTARLKQVNGIHGKIRIGPGHTLLVPSRGRSAGVDFARVNLPVAAPTVKKPVRGKKVAKGRSATKRTAAKKGGRKVAARPTGRPKSSAHNKPPVKSAAAAEPSGSRD